MIKQHLNGYRSLKATKVTLHYVNKFLNLSNTCKYDKGHVCSFHLRISKHFTNVNLTLISPWEVGIIQHYNHLFCHYRTFKYPFSSTCPEEVLPKQPIRQEISWQCICHQQSLKRSDLHPQEPLPLSKPQRLYRATTAYQPVSEHRQITHLKPMEGYVQAPSQAILYIFQCISVFGGLVTLLDEI